MFGLVIIAALLAGGLGAAIGISSERNNNDATGATVNLTGPGTGTPVHGITPGSLASVAAHVLPSVVVKRRS